MARETTNATGRGTKAGICVNNQCKNYKQIVEIAHGDLVCPECGKPLTHVAAPKKKSNNSLYIIIAAVVAIIVVVAAIFLGGGNDVATQKSLEPDSAIVAEPQASLDSVTEVNEDTVIEVNEDTVAIAPVEEPAVEETPEIKEEVEPKTDSKPEVSAPSSRSKDLGYAIWKGALKNGQPNDENGTMTYKESHRIDSRDPQARVAEPGDYIIGEFVDGKLVQGIWYDKSNTVKGSIIIGR